MRYTIRNMRGRFTKKAPGTFKRKRNARGRFTKKVGVNRPRNKLGRWLRR